MGCLGTWEIGLAGWGFKHSIVNISFGVCSPFRAEHGTRVLLAPYCEQEGNVFMIVTNANKMIWLALPCALEGS